MIIKDKFFPFIYILLSLASSSVYACGGNWRKALYWFAAAVLTFSITW